MSILCDQCSELMTEIVILKADLLDLCLDRVERLWCNDDRIINLRTRRYELERRIIETLEANIAEKTQLLRRLRWQLRLHRNFRHN